MQKSRRKKNEETKRRFNAIKDLMSTFAMSTVAVVAAVTLIPASPKTEITKAVALSEEIVYQVNITDEDNALDLSTLFVVLENQFEFYEQSIGLGENSGYFDSLEYDTQYRLSVYGSKGFGQERLDTIMITTEEKVGSTILSVTPETSEFSTTYFVDVSTYDPDSLFSTINLYYGYSWEEDVDIQYSAIPITSSRMTIELSDIYTPNDFHLYVEGITTDGTELLDEIWVTPPFELHASAYMDYINNESISFYVYSELEVGQISYEMNVYKDNLLINTHQASIEEDMHESNGIIVDGLSPNTTYSFECTATFTNPRTLRQEQKIIFEQELTTLGEYSIDYSVERFDDYIEATIIIDDPNHYFQNAYYESLDTSGEYNMYLTNEMFPFINNGGTKSATMSITIPSSSSYQITIGIENDFDYTIRHIIDIILE